jgi:hypothetical protein
MSRAAVARMCGRDRADFYVGRGESAEWLGSLRGTATPESFAERDHVGWWRPGLLDLLDEGAWVLAVRQLLKRADAVRPVDGWPWAWPDSRLTDFAYSFHDGAVRITRFGQWWETANERRDRIVDEDDAWEFADDVAAGRIDPVLDGFPEYVGWTPPLDVDGEDIEFPDMQRFQSREAARVRRAVFRPECRKLLTIRSAAITFGT